MTENTSAPQYALRGLQLIGWRDMQHALNYLFADGELRQGTLVAINAEKMLAVEDNPEVRALIEAAEFKYADGISVVRSIRKKYPRAVGANQGHNFPLINMQTDVMQRLNLAVVGAYVVKR